MMMMTRSRTLAAAAATDAVTLSNSKSSHPTSSRRPRSQVTKKIFNKNNNVSGTHLFARSNSTIGSRSLSSDSSSWSSTNSSRSSSS
ncbi:unnamed protein product [Rotaria sordida]|uniref:Uncharacterized protein n=1 Tax=Rotaria sordida TaxID=392033 RepID=A0A820E9F2_9BILA|nr:unnamed protein product [Rotaria sordida]